MFWGHQHLIFDCHGNQVITENTNFRESCLPVKYNLIAPSMGSTFGTIEDTVLQFVSVYVSTNQKYSLRIALHSLLLQWMLWAKHSFLPWHRLQTACVVSSIVQGIAVLPLEGANKLHFTEKQDSLFSEVLPYNN